MSDTNARDADKMSAPSSSEVFLLIGIVADTTWRLFLPTIGGTILGIWLDKTFGTLPIATVIGVTLGCVAAMGLIYLQIRKVKS